MKKFEIPQMTLVHLVSENVIFASPCSFFCEECECTGFGDCLYAYNGSCSGFGCNNGYNCPDAFNCKAGFSGVA